jgi:hypothetical protein
LWEPLISDPNEIHKAFAIELSLNYPSYIPIAFQTQKIRVPAFN